MTDMTAYNFMSDLIFFGTLAFLIAMPIILIADDYFERVEKKKRRERFASKGRDRLKRVAFNQRGQLVWVD